MKINKITLFFCILGISFLLCFVSFYSYANQNTKTDITLNDLIGKITLSNNNSFTNLKNLEIPVSYNGMYLRNSSALALQKAYLSFHHSHPNVPFIIVSATRTYEHQQSIWNKKWDFFYNKTHNAQKSALNILAFSSMPATSRHHWGTDIDITSLENKYFKSGNGKILYDWLNTHMKEYGFCQPFSANRKGGYNEEKWHWSYLPLANDFMNLYSHYFSTIPQKIITEMTFKGANTLPLKQYIKEYVFNINPNCLPK